MNLDSLREMATIKQVSEDILRHKIVMLAVKKSQAQECDTAVVNLERAFHEQGLAMGAESIKAAGWERAYQQEHRKRAGFWATLRKAITYTLIGLGGFEVGRAVN